MTWLRRPANGFGWVGDGLVRFVPEGVLIVGRRLTLWGWRGRPHLIRPGEFRDVYREGNAVQVNLREGGGRRPFLRFWTEGVAEAAELVARLPTTRTIELETLLRTPQVSRQALRPAFGLLALGVLVLLALACLKVLQSPTAPVPAAASAAKISRPVAAPAPGDELQRAVAEASASEVLQARADLDKFLAHSDALTQQFATAFNALTVGGTLTQQEFADGLDKWQRPQWAALAAQLPLQSDATLRGRADREISGVITSWQRALRLYAAGLRARDSRAVNAAFDAMRDAEMHEGRARRLLWHLEARQD
jgi:hypothetical protein